MKKIYFLVDIPTRELLFITYVKRIFEHKYEVVYELLGRYNNGHGYEFFSRIKKDVAAIVVPSYNVARSKNVLTLAALAKAKIIVIHSEQLYPHIYENEKLNLKYIARYNRHVSTHIVWGDFYAEKILKNLKIDKNRIITPGNYKLEITRRLSKGVQLSKRQSPTVLFASNLSLGDYSHKQWDDFKNLYDVEINVPLNEYYRDIREKVLSIVRRLAKHHIGINFLIRPHPGEKREVYNRFFGGIENVSITGEEEFSVDLGRSDLVLTFNSSSVFEVLAAKKPCFSINVPHDIPENLMQPPLGIFDWKSERELIEILEGLSSGRTVSNSGNILKVFNQTMHKPDGDSLVSNTIAIKEALENSYTSSYNLIDKLDTFKYLIISFFKYIFIRFIVNSRFFNIKRFEHLKKVREEETKRQLVITDELVEKNCALLNDIFCEGDVLMLENYKLIETDFGIKIEDGQ